MPLGVILFAACLVLFGAGCLQRLKNLAWGTETTNQTSDTVSAVRGVPPPNR